MISVTKKDSAKLLFLLILLSSALHDSGYSFAHFQEHFDSTYSFLEQGTDSVADRSAAESVHGRQ